MVAVLTGVFTLAGVVVGAILTPYFETRWARRLRTHQILLDTLVELHDTYEKWIETVKDYRSIRVVFLDRGQSLSYEPLLEYNNRQQELTRLQQRVFAILSRLDDKELGTQISTSISTANLLLLDENIHHLDSFRVWMIESASTASTAIGKRIASAQRDG